MKWFGQRQKQSLFILVLIIIGMLVVNNRCSHSPDTPKGQVEKALKEMIEDAEQRKIAAFEKHLSDKVQDENGRGKKEILNTLRLLFLQHQSVSLHLVELDFSDNTNPDVIAADLTLLMGESVLPSDKGNFFVEFRRENDGIFRVWEVAWDSGYGY